MTGATARTPTASRSTPSIRSSSSPIPGNPQELYLESLKALGIDPRQHDIRFVEDNWEQPAISAWGLGWEVWLDGQEITQFTYFQQMGGVTLDPVSVEITYGLERILIALNNAKAIWDEEWGAGVTYGEIIRREEFEHSKYYYEVADVERARRCTISTPPKPTPVSRKVCSSPRTITSSSPRTPSTSSTPAARSALPNVKPSSAECANLRGVWRRGMRSRGRNLNIRCSKSRETSIVIGKGSITYSPFTFALPA
jgi:hypothetical protein